MASWATRGRSGLLLFVLWHCASAFLRLPSHVLKVPSATKGRQLRQSSGFAARGHQSLVRSLRCILAEDQRVINEEFSQLLAGADVLKTIDVLRKHRGVITLDWDKASALLDRISDTKNFQRQVEELMAESGQAQEMTSMVGSPLLAFQRYQKEQLEATSLVYDVLKEKKLLRAFSCLSDVKAYSDAYLPKPVSPADIEARASLPMVALSPGKSQNYWVYAGGILCVAELLICAYLGVDAGAVIPATIFAFFFDRFALSGQVFDQFARIFLPRYKERIIRHEAGHFLLAYLLGCPVQGCVLRPVWNGALLGEAGTIFLDKKLFDELDRQRISASSVDRYSTVVMGGIAAEALSFENAQGGGSDEQAILLLLSLMSPPWDFERITSQARWGALRALLVLKDYNSAYEALVQALTRGDSLGGCIRAIEDTLKDREQLVPLSAIVEPVRPPPPQYDDFKRVLMPSGDDSLSSSSSRAGMPDLPPDVPEEVRTAMEAFRKAAEDSVTPSFDGADAIRLKEEKEEKEMAAQEKALEARLRELENKLKRVNSRIDGTPEGQAEEEFRAGEKQLEEEAAAQRVPDDSVISEQLKNVDARLKQLKAMLGE